MANMLLTSRRHARAPVLLIVLTFLFFVFIAMESVVEAMPKSDGQDTSIIAAYLNSNCDVATEYCEAEHDLVMLGDKAIETLKEAAEAGPPKRAIDAIIKASGELWDDNQAFLKSEDGKKYAEEYSKINGERTRAQFIESETAIFIKGYKDKSIRGVKLIKGEVEPTGLSAPEDPPTIYGEEIDNLLCN